MTAVTKWPILSLFTAAQVVLLRLVDGEVKRLIEAFLRSCMLIRVEDEAVVLQVFTVTKWLQQNEIVTVLPIIYAVGRHEQIM